MLNSKIEPLKENQARLEAEMKTGLDKLERKFEKMDEKLDRLLAKQK